MGRPHRFPGLDRFQVLVVRETDFSWMRLARFWLRKGSISTLARSNPDGIFDLADEDLSVADLSGPRRFHNGVEGFLELVVP